MQYLKRSLLTSSCHSLSVGIAILLLGAVLVRPAEGAEHVPVYSILNHQDIQLEVGSRAPTQNGISIVLDKSGIGVITLPVPEARLQEYEFAHLLFAHTPPAANVTMFWTLRGPDSRTMHRWTIASAGTHSRWITLSGIEDWTGQAAQLGFIFQGPAGTVVELEEISLLPFSVGALAKSTYQEWASFSPWTISSINIYRGTLAKNALLHPVPVMASILGLCILGYYTLCRLRKVPRPISWPMVWGLTLACWVLLDIAWQLRLVRQLEITHSTFSGKSSDEKIAASADGELFKLIKGVKKRIDTPDARIFVASSVDYLGMRGAYYLYPHNVFWNRYGTELPQRSFIHPGDYIVLIQPSAIRYDSVAGTLYLPEGEAIAVQPVASRKSGQAFRAL